MLFQVFANWLKKMHFERMKFCSLCLFLTSLFNFLRLYCCLLRLIRLSWYFHSQTFILHYFMDVMTTTTATITTTNSHVSASKIKPSVGWRHHYIVPFIHAPGCCLRRFRIRIIFSTQRPVHGLLFPPKNEPR